MGNENLITHTRTQHTLAVRFDHYIFVFYDSLFYTTEYSACTCVMFCVHDSISRALSDGPLSLAVNQFRVQPVSVKITWLLPPINSFNFFYRLSKSVKDKVNGWEKEEKTTIDLFDVCSLLLARSSTFGVYRNKLNLLNKFINYLFKFRWYTGIVHAKAGNEGQIYIH